MLTKFGVLTMQKKHTDFGGYKSDLDVSEKLMVAIVRASETFKKEADAIFRNYGLTFSQYNVLRVLNNSPGGRNTITNASRIMLVSGANMTGIAKRLEKNGFIIRKNDATDERVTLLEITPKGKQAIKHISVEKDALIETFLQSFSAEEIDNALTEVKRILQKQPIPGSKK
jgi:MarR family 2-MHQ and catechol resistance regulon transcriptional repressor